MRFHLKRPTLKSSVPWVAQLALAAILFQVTAIDHDLGLAGDEMNHVAHSTHCHGAAAGCADQGGMLSLALPQLPRLSTPDPTPFETHVDYVTPAEPFLGVPFEPPQL